MSMSDNYCVYVYLDPRKPGPFKYSYWTFSHEPIYVGMGRPNRPFSHMRGTHNIIFRGKLAHIKEANLEPIVIIKSSDLPIEEAYRQEVKMIRLIGRLNLDEGPLSNLTDCTHQGPKRVGACTKALISSNTTKQMASMSLADYLYRSLCISESLKSSYLKGRRDAVQQGKTISDAKRAKGSFFQRMSVTEQQIYSAKRSASSKRTQAAIRSDPDRYRDFCLTVGANSKKMHAKMPDEKRLERAEKIRQAVLRQHAQMTPEQKAQRNARISDTLRRKHHE